jgi:hypothetical protein
MLFQKTGDEGIKNAEGHIGLIDYHVKKDKDSQSDDNPSFPLFEAVGIAGIRRIQDGFL